MVVRRKYRVQGFKDGGAVPIADIAAAEPVLVPSADVTPPPASEVSPVDETDQVFKRAIEAQRNAELMQREAAQQRRQPTLEEVVEAIPGLSNHKRRMIMEHPELLEPERADIARRAHAEALQAGIEDDTLEMDQHLLASLAKADQQRHRLNQGAKAVSAPPPTPEIERAVQELDREVSALQETIPIERAPERAQPVYPPIARTSRMPITAPVSRDVPSYSGQQIISDRGKITLTAEERDIARRSFTDPRMSNEEKERSYGMQKLKLARMRADGTYPERERG
ncbi:hypothetical protein [Bradyrhizobium sp. WSM471]|uniref:hypothetical protein n=1 Tax=Bradyrhizobium sp. WSM471 TaxID=319017 RepID=UPI00024D2D97|nr:MULTISPECIES: hypothetical protein [Bradyrhizobium]EHR03222.1 hypothetical protein Bra471DRAFT_03991 [Bradyrhizobium sp. WSM471]UFW38450.1 hypothetical protein BcanWSM471_19585 [Bradyrhizobium canariense]